MGVRLPNWRIASEYAYTENLTFRQWAWEFLRRSKAYRELWNALQEFTEKEFAGKQVGDPVLMPIGLFDFGTQLGLKNHLPGPDAPAYELPDLQWAIGLAMQKMRVSNLPDHPAIVVFAYNLALPIDAQIEAVASEIRLLKREYEEAGHPAIKPPNIRVRKDLWTTYLRLDAKLAGASIGEMGRVVFADTHNPRGNAQNALRKAQKFAESDYRQLLLLKDPDSPHLRPEEQPIPRPMVRVLLGADWGKHPAGKVVEVDADRGDWLLANLPGSRLVD